MAVNAGTEASSFCNSNVTPARQHVFVKWLTLLCLVCSASGQLAGVKKLYVEPFAVKEGSDKLRANVISELRKLPEISVVTDHASADATLSGDGEIWVRGYKSLNPRSGRLPSDGTPVYAGFLSVEIKDTHGETLWSYLVTPGAGSEDIQKELSKRIAKHLAEALEHK
jgi:hypothetical protein